MDFPFAPWNLNFLNAFSLRKVRILGRGHIISVCKNCILPLCAEVELYRLLPLCPEDFPKLKIAVDIRGTLHPDPMGGLREKVMIHGNTPPVIFFILLNPQSKSKRLSRRPAAFASY
jgi:hypothetical protein